jgi:hypothetical protein
MKQLIAFLAGCTACMTIIAGEVDVPNTFSAGTPARAAEVNQNFDALETGIDDNAQRLNTLEMTAQAPTIDVLQQNVLVGDQVDINGQLLTINSLEFVRLDNDTDYVIEYPTPLNGEAILLNAIWVTEPRDLGRAVPGQQVFSLTLNGFAAHLNQDFRQTQQCSSIGSCFGNTALIRNALGVQVGPETLLSLVITQTVDSVGTKEERQALMNGFLDLLPYIEIRPK